MDITISYTCEWGNDVIDRTNVQAEEVSFLNTDHFKGVNPALLFLQLILNLAHEHPNNRKDMPDESQQENKLEQINQVVQVLLLFE